MSTQSAQRAESERDEEVLLEEWQTAVNECIVDLNRGERDLMHAFEGPSDLITDLRKMHDQYPSHQTVIDRVSPFFSIVKELMSSLQAALPRLKELKLVDGGAYMVIKRGLPSPDATRQLLRMLSSMTDHMRDFDKCRLNAKDSDVWRRQLARIFIAMIRLWTVSVRVLRRAVPNEERLQRGWTEIQSAMNRAINDMNEAIEHVQKMTEEANQSHSFRMAEISNVVASMNDFEDAQALFPVWCAGELTEPYFVGRKDELHDIDNAFQSTKRPTGPAVVVISGLGGLGKSALAAEYARQCREQNKYDAILWIEAESEASMQKSFTEAAMHLLLPRRSNNDTENHIYVKQWLNVTKKRWLIVFDNVDEPNLLSRYRPYGSGSIVITTRIPRVARALRARNIELRKFSRQESLKAFNLFRKGVTDMDLDDQADDFEDDEAEDLDFVLDELDGLALGIRQVANYIYDAQWTLKEFREKYRSMCKDVLSDSYATKHTLASAWDVQFDDLQKRNPNAHLLLGLICLLNADAIPSEVFLAQTGSISTDRYRFCEDKGRLESATISLSQSGLIQRSRGTFSVHRLVQSAFKHSRYGLEDHDDLQQAIDMTAKLLDQHFPKHVGAKSLHDEWHECSKYLQHVQSLSESFVSSDGQSKEVRSSHDLDDLFKNCCWYLYETGQYSAALTLLKIAKDISINRTSAEYATLCQASAAITLELYDLPACRQANEECLYIRQKLFDNNHDDIANVLHNMGNLLTSEGRYEEAAASFSKTRQIRAQSTANSEIYMGLLEMGLSRVHLSQRDIVQARVYNKDAESILSALGANAEALYLFVYLDRGNIELRSQNIEEAARCFQKAHEMAAKISKTQFIISLTLYKLGSVELLKGNYKDARSHLAQAMTIAQYHRVRGHEARICRAQWRLFQADPQATKAEQDSITELRHRAEEIKKAIKDQNQDAWKIQPNDEEAEYDFLVCCLFR